MRSPTGRSSSDLILTVVGASFLRLVAAALRTIVGAGPQRVAGVGLWVLGGLNVLVGLAGVAALVLLGVLAVVQVGLVALAPDAQTAVRLAVTAVLIVLVGPRAARSVSLPRGGNGPRWPTRPMDVFDLRATDVGILQRQAAVLTGTGVQT